MLEFSPEELGPGLDGFLSPEPDPGEDAEEEEHEILDHVDREVREREVRPNKSTSNIF